MNGSHQTVEIPSILEDDCLEVLKKGGVHFLRDDLSCRNEYEHRERQLPLLQQVRLPEGWSLKVSGNCHKRLYDSKGRVRAKMFHKAAFWDQRADMRACARFCIVCEAFSSNPRMVFTVRDGDENGPVIFTSAEYSSHSLDEYNAIWGTPTHDRFRDEDRAESERALKECRDWLDANYPDWRNKSAYWD